MEGREGDGRPYPEGVGIQNLVLLEDGGNIGGVFDFEHGYAVDCHFECVAVGGNWRRRGWVLLKY